MIVLDYTSKKQCIRVTNVFPSFYRNLLLAIRVSVHLHLLYFDYSHPHSFMSNPFGTELMAVWEGVRKVLENFAALFLWCLFLPCFRQCQYPQKIDYF